MSMILEGVRVLDWTIFQQGPVSTMLLGDMGADVIKIEERGIGDPARAIMRMLGTVVDERAGRNPYYEYNNRNKRCLVLDLNKEEGRKIVYELVSKSDVFVQNYRMGVAEKVGMDYKTLSKYNPKLIYAHASGWGPTGPDKDEPSADYTGVARSGLMWIPGEPGMPPLQVAGGVGDQMGAIMTAFGVMSALYARDKFGIGQKVDVSLLGSLTAGLLGLHVAMNLISGISTFRVSRSKMGNPLWNYYACSDGKWIALAHLQPDKFWPNVCQAMDLQHLEKDARFDTLENRAKNCEELISILDKAFATKTGEEWMKKFKENGVIYSRINDISDLGDDPQVLASNYITEWSHPEWGQTKVTGFPIAFEKTPMSIRREAPAFGQHTEEVLIDLLGYDWDQITILKDAEVI